MNMENRNDFPPEYFVEDRNMVLRYILTTATNSLGANASGDTTMRIFGYSTRLGRSRQED